MSSNRGQGSLIRTDRSVGGEFFWIFHTAAQIALDYLKEILDTLDPTNPDPLLEKRLVDTSRDFERYVQEGLQKDASQ